MSNFNIIITYWGKRSQDWFECYDWLETREALTDFIVENVGAYNAKWILKVSCALHQCIDDKKWEGKPVPEWHKTDWTTVYEYGCFPTKSDKKKEEWSEHVKENINKDGAPSHDDGEKNDGDDEDKEEKDKETKEHTVSFMAHRKLREKFELLKGLYENQKMLLEFAQTEIFKLKEENAMLKSR